MEAGPNAGRLARKRTVDEVRLEAYRALVDSKRSYPELEITVWRAFHTGMIRKALASVGWASMDRIKAVEKNSAWVRALIGSRSPAHVLDDLHQGKFVSQPRYDVVSDMDELRLMVWLLKNSERDQYLRATELLMSMAGIDLKTGNELSPDPSRQEFRFRLPVIQADTFLGNFEKTASWSRLAEMSDGAEKKVRLTKLFLAGKVFAIGLLMDLLWDKNREVQLAAEEALGRFSFMKSRVEAETAHRDHFSQDGAMTPADEEKGLRSSPAEVTPGGIDLNADNMSFSVDSSVPYSAIQFDADQQAQLQRGDFSGIRPRIIGIWTVPVSLPLFGMGADSNVGSVLANG